MASLERRLEALEAEQKLAAADECRAILDRLSDHELARFLSPFVRMEMTGEEVRFNDAEQAVVDKVRAQGWEQHAETAIGHEWRLMSKYEFSKKVDELVGPVCKPRKQNLVWLMEEYAKEFHDD